MRANEIMAIIPQAAGSSARRRLKPSTSISGNFSQISISGTLDQGSYSQIGQALQESLLDDTEAVIILIDSPGGSVYGLQELSDTIFASRRVKPILSLINPLAGSAAYMLAAACSECYCTPSGEVGGIGVVSAHIDQSAAMRKAGVNVTLISAGQYKVEGNPYEPLDDEAREWMQCRLDEIHSAMLTRIGAYRGKTAKYVQTQFGAGRLLGATDARLAGMIDSITTPQGLQRRLKSNQVKAKTKSAALCRKILKTL